jgi:serine/threonine-protein kinase
LRRLPLTPGETFAGYTITRFLGSGTVGGVYLAQHPGLQRRVALKIVRSESTLGGDFRSRLDRTLQRVRSLQHRHIAGMHDWGSSGRTLWVATDYVDGANAMQWLQDRYPNGMPPAAVLTITAAIADALDYAHRNGVLHLRVKPTNIMVANPDSTAYRIILADLGIGSVVSRWPLYARDVYSAPEQATPSNRLDRRADQYSLAACALRMLTGAGADTGTGVRSAGPAIEELARTKDIPALNGMQAALGRALSVEPEMRYPTCKRFVADLAPGSSHPSYSARCIDID